MPKKRLPKQLRSKAMRRKKEEMTDEEKLQNELETTKESLEKEKKSTCFSSRNSTISVSAH